LGAAEYLPGVGRHGDRGVQGPDLLEPLLPQIDDHRHPALRKGGEVAYDVRAPVAVPYDTHPQHSRLGGPREPTRQASVAWRAARARTAPRRGSATNTGRCCSKIPDIR